MTLNYIFLFEIIVGIYTAFKAKQKNRNPFVWLLLGVAFSLLALAVVYVIPVKTYDEGKKVQI